MEAFMRRIVTLSSEVALLIFAFTVVPAGAGIKGGLGHNGERTRPFYIVAHNPNVPLDVDQALDAGANALGPDVMQFSSSATFLGYVINDYAGPSGLFMYHDNVDFPTRMPTTVEDYLEHVHSKVVSGYNVAMIEMDIKYPARRSVLQLVDAVHQHLNYGGVNVSVIYGVDSFEAAAEAFTPAVIEALADNEGIEITGVNEPAVVFQTLFGYGAKHVAFANGASVGISTGGAPNVLPSIDQASWWRAATIWDQNAYTNGGVGFGVSLPEAWSIPVDDPPYIGELPLALIGGGIDGLMADRDLEPQDFHTTLTNIGNLTRYVEQYDLGHYVATADDNPFYVPPEAYALRIWNGSGVNDGTDATIGVALEGECGVSWIPVNGNFAHRFASGEVTFVTLPSKNLGRLTNLYFASSSSNTWRPAWVDISSARWGIPLGLGAEMVNTGGLIVDEDHSPVSFTLSGKGYTCDLIEPRATPSADPPANSFGWNSTDLTVTWNWEDNEGGSGIRPVACTESSPFAGEGVRDVSASCFDVDGNEGTASYTVRIDKTAPSLQCGAPDGLWHATDVSLACTGSDLPGQSANLASGLAHPADANFSVSTSVPADMETSNALTGSHTVLDKAGNGATIGPIGGNKIDKKAPVIDIRQPLAATYTHSATLVLNYNVTDGGSGVASVQAALNGSTSIGGQVLSNGLALTLLTSLPPGPYTFSIDSADRAGNRSSSSVKFNIVVTPQSLIEAVSQFQDHGLDQRGNSLVAKLSNAAASFMGGKCRAAGNQYGAFINEVRAQTGKTITPIVAGILIGDAQYLIAHCQ